MVHWYPSSIVEINNAIAGITNEIYPDLSGPILPNKFKYVVKAITDPNRDK